MDLSSGCGGLGAGFQVSGWVFEIQKKNSINSKMS